MIPLAKQLDQAMAQWVGCSVSLIPTATRYEIKNPRNFAVLAEGPLEQLWQLQRQIDEYIRRLEPGKHLTRIRFSMQRDTKTQSDRTPEVDRR